MKGIDVSSYQGNIDWKKVGMQVDFAIIRCGYGDDVVSQDDRNFLDNVRGCIENGIPYGVYLYSYAKNKVGEESIQSEVMHVLRLLQGKNPFCVYLDMEDDGTKYLGKEKLTDLAVAFCKQITDAGYKAGVYANENWFLNYLDAQYLSELGYSLWCAKYGNNRPRIGVDYDIWQYSSTGSVDGIISNVDMNEMVNDILGIRGEKPEETRSNVNVFYRVKTKSYGWLPEVKNLTDYAGFKNDFVTGLAIRVDKGIVRYRVHLKGKNWLGYVTGYDINDIKNGYAGNGKDVIDAVEVYYVTPEDIRPKKRAKYKVNHYAWQYDNEKGNGQDGYAGKIGVGVYKFQIVIE